MTFCHSSPPIIADITALAFTGKGIARLDNKICFVDDVFPGDRVRIVVTRDKGNFFEGRLCEIIEPSRHRVVPQCPHAAICGGCRWMGLHYDQQLVWKKRFIEDSLQRIGRMDRCLGELSVLPSARTLGYRNRIQLKCEIPSKGEFRIGYYAPGTHDLVPIGSCAIADAMIRRYLEELPRQALRAFSAMRFSLEIAVVMAEAAKSRALMVTIYDETRRDDKLGAVLGAQPFVVWCGYGRDAAKAPFFATASDISPRLFTRPLLFQQVNEEQNQNLKDRLHSWVAEVSPEHILDLCCGNGNLSLALAMEGQSVTGIESHSGAVACARHALAFNQIAAAEYLSGDAFSFLARCLKEGRRYDLCILDPPRAGLGNEMQLMLQIAPSNIIYVSCNPSTLARDISRISPWYEVVRVEGFDFFPHSYHVETMVLLVKKAPPAL